MYDSSASPTLRQPAVTRSPTPGQIPPSVQQQRPKENGNKRPRIVGPRGPHSLQQSENSAFSTPLNAKNSGGQGVPKAMTARKRLNLDTSDPIDLTTEGAKGEEDEPRAKKKNVTSCKPNSTTRNGGPPPPPPSAPPRPSTSTANLAPQGACANPPQVNAGQDDPQPPTTPAHLVNVRDQSSGRARPRFLFPLGRGRYVSLSHFSGVTSIHVREYRRQSSTGLLYPTPVGVMLGPYTARALIHELPEIILMMEDAMELGAMGGQQLSQRTWYLGDRLRAVIDLEWGASLNLRHFFLPEGETEEMATRRGVRLNADEISNLLDILRTIEGHWPALAEVRVPCYIDHAMEENQEAILNCPRCMPMI